MNTRTKRLSPEAARLILDVATTFGHTADDIRAHFGTSETPVYEERAWLSVADASKYIGVSPTTLTRKAKAGLITSVKLTPGSKSGKVLYEKKSLDLWLDSLKSHCGTDGEGLHDE